MLLSFSPSPCIHIGNKVYRASNGGLHRTINPCLLLSLKWSYHSAVPISTSEALRVWLIWPSRLHFIHLSLEPVCGKLIVQMLSLLSLTMRV